MDRHDAAGCFSRKGTPLRAFHDQAAAEQAAAYALAAYGTRTIPYLCRRCDRWHLGDAARHTPSRECSACSKQAYETEECAERRAAILLAERGVRLRVYACPYGEGWHLTSRA